MDIACSEDDLQCLEALPLEERAAALEEIERRLRDALEDVATA